MHLSAGFVYLWTWTAPKGGSLFCGAHASTPDIHLWPSCCFLVDTCYGRQTTSGLWVALGWPGGAGGGGHLGCASKYGASVCLPPDPPKPPFTQLAVPFWALPSLLQALIASVLRCQFRRTTTASPHWRLPKTTPLTTSSLFIKTPTAPTITSIMVHPAPLTRT